MEDGVAAAFKPGLEQAANAGLCDIATESGRRKENDQQYERYDPEQMEQIRLDVSRT
jgi:hypothetical protein